MEKRLFACELAYGRRQSWLKDFGKRDLLSRDHLVPFSPLLSRKKALLVIMQQDLR